MPTLLKSTRLVLLLAILAMVAFVATAQADIIFQATMLPASVVPPSSADAYGMATIIVTDSWSDATYTVNFAGLESAQTSAVLMHAAVGANGPTLVELPLGAPLAGHLTVTAELHDALEAGDLAIQISEVNFPDGSIRGNFSFVTVPTEDTSWSQVKALFQ